MQKNMRIRMTDPQTGTVYIWTVRHTEAFNVGIPKPRKVVGWSFFDHDGYERFAEGNWGDLVAMFNLVAGNYGFTCNLS